MWSCFKARIYHSAVWYASRSSKAALRPSTKTDHVVKVNSPVLVFMWGWNQVPAFLQNFFFFFYSHITPHSLSSIAGEPV